MSEWQRIIAGTVIGFASAILLEPIKHLVERYFAAKRAKKNIYTELARLYSVFCLADERHEELYCSNAFSLGPTDAFEYYYHNQRETFYAIKQHEEIRGFYEVFAVIKNCVAERQVTSVNGAVRVGDEFKFRFANRFIDELKVTSKALKSHEGYKQTIQTPLTDLGGTTQGQKR